MKSDLTADDLWPLVSKLSPQEQVRLAKLALRAAALVPKNSEELSPNEDPLSWEAEGWDGFDWPR